MFSAPIPGQSLTSEPKNSPWENPPLMTNPEEALLWHIEQFENPEKVKGVGGLLILGLDLVTLTEGILRGAVAKGQHSIDISLSIADASGIEYVEGLDDEDEMDLSVVEMSLREREAKKILKDIKSDKDIDISSMKDLADDTEEEPMPDMKELMLPVEPQEEKSMGLMTRRTA
jgi:hypothetical protein